MSKTDGLPANLAATNVRIKGMTTDEIARAIRGQLVKMPGVISVRMSITDQSARVEYEPSRLSPTHIGAMIGQMGYSVTVRSMQRTM
ncbi:MAG TPA: heavy metal-associated domain-containing protein [Blastocatellia bacterium]|nr:heavy metal-associated domain-containing protein [Blastocatellia bacterium]